MSGGIYIVSTKIHPAAIYHLSTEVTLVGNRIQDIWTLTLKLRVVEGLGRGVVVCALIHVTVGTELTDASASYRVRVVRQLRAS
jgi:hypothetical protein